MQSFKQILGVENTKKKVSDDLGDHSKAEKYFEVAQNESMSVHDCKPGDNEDDKSEYTYVSVSNMSNN